MITPASGGEPEQVNDSPVIAERILDLIDAAKLSGVPKAAAFRSAEAMEWYIYMIYICTYRSIGL